MKFLTTTLLLFLSILSFAQSTSFGPANDVIPIEGELHEPDVVVASDLDGDGDKDVLTLSTSNDKVVWYRNLDGAGTFGEQMLISDQTDGVGSIFAADIDGDGDVDVLSASFVDDKIAWYENQDGEGTFGNQRVIADNLNEAWDIEAADFDGDGDIDVAAVSYEDKIVWYENQDGLGDFSDEMIISETFTAYALTTGDIDGDGDLDILAGSPGFGIVVFRNDGSGDFAADQIPEFESTTSLNLHDLDLDGDLDITASFIGFSFNSYSFWYENTDGEGTFQFAEFFDFNFGSYDYSESIWPYDIDSDGDLDILASSFGKIGWCENENGTYCEAAAFEYLTEEDGYFILDDLDNDARLDIVAAGEGYVSWYKNESNEQAVDFGLRRVISDYAKFDIYSFALADVDTDGAVDVVVTSPLDNSVTWHKNIDGSGIFEVQDALLLNFRQVYTADFDNDGDPDLLMDRFSQGMAWYRNEAAEFSLAQDFIMDEPIRSALPKDIDLDGDIDILVHKSTHSIVWYENLDGLGGFSNPKIIVEDDNASITKVAIADVDGDNDLDIPIILNGLSNLEDSIAWYKNLGGDTPSWSTEADIFYIDTGLEFEDRMIGLSTADINGDDNEDFIVSYPSKVVWFENINGSYNNYYTIAENLNTPNIGLKDLDNDSDVDLMVADIHGAYWYENLDGAGQFGTQHQIATQGLRDLITAEDLDNDGDLDIIGSYFAIDKIYWHENYLIGPSSVDNLQEEVHLKVFPNPFRGLIKIEFDADVELQSASVSVRDINGKLLKEKNITAGHTLFLNGADLPSGIYMVNLRDITSGRLFASRLLVKQ